MHVKRSIVALAVTLCSLIVSATAQDRGAGGRGQRGPAGPAMTLTTPAWADGTPIPVKYTQAGEQVSPELKWTNTPAGTQSFVLHMHDPDVAINRGTEDQVHWLVWNIPGTATGLPEGLPQGGQLKDGSQQISASGAVYRGPGAAANGPQHHYTVEIYALDTKIDVQPSTNSQAAAAAVETRTIVMKAIQGHILGKAVYVGLFHRPQ